MTGEALFVACCELLCSVPEFEGLDCTMGGRWDDRLLSLRTRNYGLLEGRGDVH